VEVPMVEAFCEAIVGSYHRRTGILPQIYISAPARGAHEMIP